MKKVIFFIFVVAVSVAAYYFWPSEPGGGKMSVGDMVSSLGKDYAQELALKQTELKATEDALNQVEAQIAQWDAETEKMICPQTGHKAIGHVEKDPRPELRERISTLQREIAKLELKVKK